MKNDGQIITETVRQMQRIYDQVSLLLQTADSLMKDSEWPADSSVVRYGSSSAVTRADGWLLTRVIRSYTNTQYKNKRKTLAAVLECSNQYSVIPNAMDAFPLLIGTTITAKTQDTLPAWMDWDADWWYLKFQDRATANNNIILTPETDYSDDTRNLDKVETFAVPLTDIQDSESLRDRVITRLLSDNC